MPSPNPLDGIFIAAEVSNRTPPSIKRESHCCWQRLHSNVETSQHIQIPEPSNIRNSPQNRTLCPSPAAPAAVDSGHGKPCRLWRRKQRNAGIVVEASRRKPDM